MKILAIALAPEAQQFIKGYPPKGAWLFLRPDTEISRLATLAINDDFFYLDTRVQQLVPSNEYDLVLARVDFAQEKIANWLVEEFSRINQSVVLFGPQVTAWNNAPPEWVTHRVKGDITNIFTEICNDARRQRLKSVYEAPNQPSYTVPKQGIGKRPVMNYTYQTIQFVRGCACPEDLRSFCPEYLYYQGKVLLRPREEVIGEVLSLPGKHIHLLDDDIARFPDYYTELFRLLWNYHRHWTVTAGDEIFRHRNFIQLIAKAGTKIIFLNETFLNPRIPQALKDATVVKRLYRRVKFLQSRRMLVGAKLTLRVDEPNFPGIARLLSRIDLDFVEIRFIASQADGKTTLVPVSYHPGLKPDEPAWVKSHFYSFTALVDRFVRRPRRVGFYSTAMYLIPYSLAYRQNFLEGVPYP